MERRTAGREVYHSRPRLTYRPSCPRDRNLQADDLSDDLLTSRSAGQAESAAIRPARILVEYRKLDALASSPAGLLGAVRFGAGTHSASTAPLTIAIQLEPLQGPAAEVWLASSPVQAGQAGIVRYAHDAHFLLALVEEDERSHGGIKPAAEAVYAAIRRFQQHSPFPHLLRMWNYLDAINEGTGDQERYRQFCVGRARGMGDAASGRYPAATAIGRQRKTHELQVLWLAGRDAGTAVENPRQVSAYHYPRAHGPVSPSFSRATVTRDHTVLISGTASIVGHVSQHPGDALGQLEETLRNLSALTPHPRRQDGSGRKDLFKIYVRDPALVQPVAARLLQVHPESEAVFLAGDICRRELLLEIECIRGSGDGPAGFPPITDSG